MKFKNKKCSCGFDLSTAEPGVRPGIIREISPGEYMEYCPSCRAAAQPVVEGEPEKPEVEPEPES